jgi:hypothetical protein
MKGRFGREAQPFPARHRNCAVPEYAFPIMLLGKCYFLSILNGVRSFGTSPFSWAAPRFHFAGHTIAFDRERLAKNVSNKV